MLGEVKGGVGRGVGGVGKSVLRCGKVCWGVGESKRRCGDMCREMFWGVGGINGDVEKGVGRCRGRRGRLYGVSMGKCIGVWG